ncbi:MAG: AAA family ATPase [Deltaproteobacteria bacterium]|nr:AAA family ATPase [Deltaproteobacteria bacterium]MBW2138426.1 AAA family ATPase [Deltaproteobacteria bacterium]
MVYNNSGEKERSGKLPNQKELEKELGEYLSKKYGDRIKIISPFLFPKGQEVSTDEVRYDEKSGKGPHFDMLPEELEAHLDNFVVKQAHAKAVLATKICTHFNRIKYLKKHADKKKTAGVGMIKNNVLMIGPTGVGKTYIIKLIAQKLGVPFVKGDATKFSETGYVGGDVEDLVRDLVHEANDDISLAENGIIYIDEIDKIASAKNIIGHDVSRTGVQRALLKPMEETDVDLKVPHDAVSQIQAIEHYRRTGKKEKRVVNTRNILFIMSGAFGDLAEIIKKRLQKQGLGFEADVRPNEIPWEILKEVTAQDLIEFGFESEFVGRLPVVVVFDELKEEDLVEILQNPNNPIILSKRQDFGAYGIDIKFEEEALSKIARMAAAERTGARGLVSACEKVLIPFEKTLPSTHIDKLLVTPELVDNPEAELADLQKDPYSPGRLERFSRASEKEMENLKGFIKRRANDFHQLDGLNLYDKRMELIGEIYLKLITDVNTAIETFREMHDRIKREESSLYEKLEIDISLEDSAIDELIKEAIRTGEDTGKLTFQLAKKLEYGLKLVKDRSGTDRFTVTGDAVTDMESYINELVKKYYRQDCHPPYGPSKKEEN